MTNGTNWTENRTNRKRKTSLIPPHGGYRKLKSYQSAEIVFDLTKIFCEKFLSPRNRTNGTNWISRTNRTNGTDWTSRSFRQIEQMVQAARSGKQNIAEGSMASGTSKKTELKLVGVARASLEELLLDFEDFLRRRGLKKWGKSDPLAVEIRNLVYRSNRTCKTYWTYFEEEEGAANVLICLIHQTNFLLDRQLHALEKFFLREGGFTEKLYRERMKRRNVFRC